MPFKCIFCDWNPELFLLILVALISIAQAAVEADSSSLQGSLFGQKTMQIFSGVCGWGELFSFHFFQSCIFGRCHAGKNDSQPEPSGLSIFLMD